MLNRGTEGAYLGAYARTHVGPLDLWGVCAAGPSRRLFGHDRASFAGIATLVYLPSANGPTPWLAPPEGAALRRGRVLRTGRPYAGLGPPAGRHRAGLATTLRTIPLGLFGPAWISYVRPKGPLTAFGRGPFGRTAANAPSLVEWLGPPVGAALRRSWDLRSGRSYAVAGTA